MTETVTTATEPDSEAVPWLRLDFRMLLVRPAVDVIRSLPVLIGTLLLGGQNSPWQWIGVAATGLAVLIGIGHCLTARYRITATQMELRTGIVHRKHRAVPRDRIRTVDVTAELRHRLFGLSAVKIGTGRHTKDRSDELVLDAVSTTEARRLAGILLRRTGAAHAAEGDAGSGEHGTVAPAETTLAEFDRRWVRYAPFALSGLATVGALAGVVTHFLHDLDLDPARLGPVRGLLDHFASTPVWISVTESAVVLLLVVVLASLGGYVLSFWNYRLSRGSGTLHVRRGLITTRSVSVEQDRLRGVQVREPLPLRAAGGARLLAVASGLPSRLGASLLLPPAPVSEVHRVAAAALLEREGPTTTALRAHPRRALVRRLVRAVGGTALLAAVLLLAARLGLLPDWPWQVALVLIAPAAVLGWDRYRALGNGLTEGYLVGRTGSLLRDTVALRRDGIIGWTIEQSFFQRRAGLATLRATIAAGRGGYPIPDLAAADAVALAEGALPGLLTPFLERTPERPQ